MKRSRLTRLVCACVLIGACTAVGPGARAEFYRWVDEHGRHRVSNIAPAGIAADGKPRAGYHPYSIVAQERRLRAALARQAAMQRAAAAHPPPALAGDDPGALDIPAASGEAANAAEYATERFDQRRVK